LLKLNEIDAGMFKETSNIKFSVSWLTTNVYYYNFFGVSHLATYIFYLFPLINEAGLGVGSNPGIALTIDNHFHLA